MRGKNKILTFLCLGVGRFTPLIPGRQRPRPNRGTGRRGRPPGSGKRSLMMTSSSGTSREAAKPSVANDIGFLSPEAASRLSDISSNNGTNLADFTQLFNIYIYIVYICINLFFSILLFFYYAFIFYVVFVILF